MKSMGRTALARSRLRFDIQASALTGSDSCVTWMFNGCWSFHRHEERSTQMFNGHWSFHWQEECSIGWKRGTKIRTNQSFATVTRNAAFVDANGCAWLHVRIAVRTSISSTTEGTGNIRVRVEPANGFHRCESLHVQIAALAC